MGVAYEMVHFMRAVCLRSTRTVNSVPVTLIWLSSKSLNYHISNNIRHEQMLSSVGEISRWSAYTVFILLTPQLHSVSWITIISGGCNSTTHTLTWSGLKNPHFFLSSYIILLQIILQLKLVFKILSDTRAHRGPTPPTSPQESVRGDPCLCENKPSAQ